MIAVRANDIFLDLPADIEDQFYITRQQRDLRSWEQRNSDFTRIITIPRTAKNANTLLPFIQAGVKTIPGDIQVNGISIDSSITLQVKGFTDNFELNVIFDNQKLFSRIQGKISELDFDDLEFSWTTAGVNGIKATTDIVYAYAHWMDLTSFNLIRNSGVTAWFDDQEIYASGFFIYVKELFTRIVTLAGFTLDTTNLIDSDLFDSTAIPCPVDKFIEEEETTISVEKQSISSNFEINSTGTRIQFDTTDIAGGGIWDSVSDTEYDFTSDVNVQVTARIQGHFLDLDLVGNFIQPTLRLVRAGIPIREWILTQSNQTSFTISINENIYVENGDELYFFVSWAKGDNVGLVINTTSWFKIASLNSDTTISVNEFLPDVSQKDFIKNALNHTNLFVAIEEDVVILYDFNNIFSNERLDAKVVQNKEELIEYSFPNLFKLSKITYKPSSPPLLRQDIDFAFRVNDESLPDEGTILELGFEGCDLINTSYNGNDITPLMEAYKYEVLSFAGLNGTSAASTFTLDNAESFEVGDWIIATATAQIRRVTSKTSATGGGIAGTWASTISSVQFHVIRIKKNKRPLKIVYIESASTFDVFSRTNASPTSITSGFKASFGSEMLLGTIADNQYADLVESFRFPKFVQIWVEVESYDILARQFLRRVVYIDKFNERFYINKIEQWKPSTKQGRLEGIRIR